VSDPHARPESAPPGATAVRLFLSAVHDALWIPVPAWPVNQRRYLKLLERRAIVARASISRIPESGSASLAPAK